MIRFCCERCGHKISVQDEHTGKRGRCPQCSAVVVIPAQSTIIEFHCKNCGRKISVPKTYEGKEAKCPKCKDIIVIPARIESPAKSVSTIRFTCSTCKRDIQEPESSRGKLIECPHCKAYVPVPLEEMAAQKAAAPARPGEENNISGQRFEQLQTGIGEMPVKEPDHVAERKLPWLIDVLLYPASVSGVIHLAIFLFLPPLAWVFLSRLGQTALFFVFVPLSAGIYLLFVGYMLYYIGLCIFDSGKGGRRAPDITTLDLPDKGELICQVFLVLGAIAICFWPAGLYYVFTKKTDLVFCVLSAGGIFFLPMALLAGILFDATHALNPVFIIGSIARTFLPYCGLVPLFCVLGGLLAVISTNIFGLPNTHNLQQGIAQIMLVLNRLFVATLTYPGMAFIYLAMVAAHLLGWFYWWHKDKLKWGL